MLWPYQLQFVVDVGRHKADMVASEAPGDTLPTGEALRENLGCGPAQWHTADACADFARFQKALDVADLERRVAVRPLLVTIVGSEFALDMCCPALRGVDHVRCLGAVRVAQAAT